MEEKTSYERALKVLLDIAEREMADNETRIHACEVVLEYLKNIRPAKPNVELFIGDKKIN